MAFNARTGQTVYNTDDLIGMARIGVFGPKSDIVLSALNHLKYFQNRTTSLEKELIELRESVTNIIQVQTSVSEITEVNVDSLKSKKGINPVKK